MSTIDLTQLTSMTQKELASLWNGGTESESSESFGDYLQRARSFAADDDGGDAKNYEKNDWLSRFSTNESSKSAESTASSINTSKYNSSKDDGSNDASEDLDDYSYDANDLNNENNNQSSTTSRTSDGRQTENTDESENDILDEDDGETDPGDHSDNQYDPLLAAFFNNNQPIEMQSPSDCMASDSAANTICVVTDACNGQNGFPTDPNQVPNQSGGGQGNMPAEESIPAEAMNPASSETQSSAGQDIQAENADITGETQLQNTTTVNIEQSETAESAAADNGTAETTLDATDNAVNQTPNDALLKTKQLHGKGGNKTEKKKPSDDVEATATDSTATQTTAADVQTSVQTAVAAAISAVETVEQTADVKSETSTQNVSGVTQNDSTKTGTHGKSTTGVGSGTGAAEDGLQFDSERFLQRVEKAFAAMGDRGGSIKLKLSPPELGSLNVEISVKNGLMSAKVQAETPEAKNLSLDNLSTLRDRLAQQDIKIQQFDVDLMNRSQDGFSQQTAKQQSDFGSGQGGDRNAQSQTKQNDESATTTSTAERVVNHSGQLNVIV